MRLILAIVLLSALQAPTAPPPTDPPTDLTVRWHNSQQAELRWTRHSDRSEIRVFKRTASGELFTFGIYSISTTAPDAVLIVPSITARGAQYWPATGDTYFISEVYGGGTSAPLQYVMSLPLIVSP